MSSSESRPAAAIDPEGPPPLTQLCVIAGKCIEWLDTQGFNVESVRVELGSPRIRISTPAVHAVPPEEILGAISFCTERDPESDQYVKLGRAVSMGCHVEWVVS